MLSAALVAACSGPTGGQDAGESRDDAGPSDAGEAMPDTGPPADGGPPDAGSQPDSGPPDAGCECASVGESTCCDGCFIRNEGESCTDTIEGTGGEGECVAGQCIGEPCECDEGPCCDGCFFRPTDYQCETEVVYEASCDDELSDACPGYAPRIWEEVGNRYCPGDASTCSGSVEHVSSRSRWCWTSEMPVYCAEDASGMASCSHTCS